MTTDTASAETFYTSVLGWNVRESGLADRSYTILGVGEKGLAGFMPLPPSAREAGARPCWSGYIGVRDVDAVAASIETAGGAIHRAPEDIPGVGRFAMAADPQGAMFVLFTPSDPDVAPTPPPGATPGHVGWHELHAAEWQAAFDFYAAAFGWTKDTAVDMGPMGLYQLFAIDGVQAGGMMTKTADFPAPAWVYYFNVAGIESPWSGSRRRAARSSTVRIRFLAAAGSRNVSIPRGPCSPSSAPRVDRTPVGKAGTIGIGHGQMTASMRKGPLRARA